jgi:hypothetical protein
MKRRIMMLLVALCAVLAIPATAAAREPASGNLGSCHVSVQLGYVRGQNGFATAIRATTAITCQSARRIEALNAWISIDKSRGWDPQFSQTKVHAAFTAAPGKTYYETARVSCPITGRQYYGTGTVSIKNHGFRQFDTQNKYLFCQTPPPSNVSLPSPSYPMAGGA